MPLGRSRSRGSRRLAAGSLLLPVLKLLLLLVLLLFAMLPVKPLMRSAAADPVTSSRAGLVEPAIGPAAGPVEAAYRGPSSRWPAAWIDDGVGFVELGLPPAGPPMSARQLAQDRLGAALFHDPLLSATGQVACASCHDPGLAWSVDRPTGVGVHGRPGRRNPPDLRQIRAYPQWGWDGRSASLAERSLTPLTDPRELGNDDLDSVLDRLAARPSHAQAFEQLNGPGPVTAAALGEVLAAHVLALAAELPRSRFGRFLAGDTDALSARELQGLHLFRTRARCANCHFGPWLSDGRFHNLLISSFGEPAQDLGRFAVTARPGDTGAFRTPSLHRVAASPPYMHSGLFPDLEGVIRFYVRGGGEVWARNAVEAAHPLHPDAARPSARLRPLDLDEDEITALAAFLRTL